MCLIGSRRKKCEKGIVEIDPSFSDFVPRQLRTRPMCENVIEENIYFFDGIQDKLKTQEMCEQAVEMEPTLIFVDVSDYFVTLPKYLNCVKMQ